jgi:anti-anti-sigma factor
MFFFGQHFIRQWWVMRQKPAIDIPSVGPMPDEPPSPVLPDSNGRRQAAVISVHGRLDVTNQSTFMMNAERALENYPFLVINLAEATFLDSSALGSLVALTNRARASGGALGLAAVPPTIAYILSLVHLDQFFEFFDDVIVALERYDTTSEEAAKSLSDTDEWIVIKTPRTLDAKSAPFLLDRCSTIPMDQAKLVLDFSETVFVSGAGLTALMKLSHELRGRGGELRAAGCSRDIVHGLKLVRLDQFIALYENVAEATQADVAALSLP